PLIGVVHCLIIFFYTHPPTTDLYSLSLHDALPILRLEVSNPRGRLVPGMIVNVDLDVPTRAVITVHADAVIDSGTKTGVFVAMGDRKSTRLNSSHSQISYAVFCLKKKTIKYTNARA